MLKNTTVAQNDPLTLNPRLDRQLIAKVFAANGRVHIPDILTAQAARSLYDGLSGPLPWALVFNDQDKVYDLGAEHVAGFTPENRIGLTNYIDTQARRGFQFLYHAMRITASARTGDAMPVLGSVLDFVNSPAFLAFARIVTGCKTISFADAQVTRFGPGHFLNTHSDDVPGKNRLAAYVLNLTPTWRPDWGGILEFVGPDGHVIEGYVPTFNALNILRVPQPHLVSVVAPYAGAPRLSVTGWLRSGPPDL